VQAHLRTLITPSTILLGHSLESDLNALKLSHARCIDTALIFHHPRGRPLKPGLAWLTRKWLGRIIQDRGPGGHNPEEDARACMDLLKAKIKNGAFLTCLSCRDRVDEFTGLGPGYGEFRADFEPILARIARSRSRNRASNGGHTRTAIVDHGNPGAWHGTSATAPVTTVSCANDTEVLDGLIGALDSHEFIFGRLMGLADALGCAWLLLTLTLPLTYHHRDYAQDGQPRRCREGRKPKSSRRRKDRKRGGPTPT
jgi:RNA exonuclease 1